MKSILAILVLCAVLVSAASAGTAVTYQGRLTDSSGSPLTGTYTVSFSLYELPSGGIPLASDTHAVAVEKGLFTTALSFGRNLYEGGDLWLGITVGSDTEMTPRQELRPVPYALGLVPGARVTGTLPVPMVQLLNNDGAALLAVATGDRSGGEEGVGVYSVAEGAGGIAVLGTARGAAGVGVGAVAENGNSCAVIAETYGTSSTGVYAATYGAHSPAIYGHSDQDAGVCGEGKAGGFFTTNGAGADYDHVNVGVNVSTYFDYNPGIQTRTTGAHSAGVRIATEGRTSYGVSAITLSDYSTGMLTITEGYTSPGVVIHTSGGNSHGLYADAQGPDSPGITGSSRQARGVEGYTYSTSEWVPAVYGSNEGAGDGVYGLSMERYGVFGKGNEGGYFTTNAAGTSATMLAGVNVSTLFNFNPGILVQTIGSRAEGVFANTAGDYSIGLRAETSGMFSPGVSVTTKDDQSDGVVSHTDGDNSEAISIWTMGVSSEGLYARTEGSDSPGVAIDTSGSNSPGVHAFAQGIDSRGIFAYSSHSEGIVGQGVNAAGVKGESATKAGLWGVSDSDVGLYAVTNRADDKYGIYTPDYLYAKGAQYPAVDVAEYFPVEADAAPATVMVIGNDGRLQPSSTPYDTKVAGIVSTDPAVSLGTKDTGNEGEAAIAVAGRVPCRVDAFYGAIRAGDLLTTSATPGHAMKAENPQIGTVLGKALGSLETGTGVIDVIVTLQ